MRLGLRGKLFLVSVALILVVGLASGAFLEGRLRTWLDARVDDDLEWRLRAARVLVEQSTSVQGLDRSDRLADAVGQALGSRVTILALDGTVLGDSHVRRVAVEDLENHRARPEIAAALSRGWGQSQRFSHTDGLDMRYRASRFHRPDGVRGVVRVATSLEEVERAVHALRLLLVGAGGLGLVIAILMSGLSSHLQWRTFLDLLRDPRALAEATGAALDDEGVTTGPAAKLRRELRRAVGSLGEERDRFDAVLQGLSEAVLALDRDQKVTLANAAALQLLGLSRSPVGAAFVEVIRLPAIAELVRSASSGRAGTAEIDLLVSPPRRVLARATPLPSGAGTVIVLLDVTDTRKLDAVRRDFVANASHELRTPISVIRANAETLLDGAMDDPVHGKPMLEALLRNADRMARVVSDLLDISRIESGGWEIQPVAVNVRAAASHVTDRIAPAARSRNVTLEVRVPEPISVRVDAKALDLVLSNLVENAAKYCDEGGRVEIDATEIEGGGVTIEVRDDGPGVEPRHRDRIFERFYRVDPGRSRAVGGTGLGLSIVKNLVEVMGGKVEVRPRSPRGAIFSVELPSPASNEPTAG